MLLLLVFAIGYMIGFMFGFLLPRCKHTQKNKDDKNKLTNLQKNVKIMK